jgi:hypothetical protein
MIARISRSLVAAVGAVLVAGAAWAEPVGFLAVAEGTVEVKSAGAASFAAAAVDREISVGDTIRTGRASLAKLVLQDDTVLTIDEETELLIDQYVLGPSAAQEPSRIDLLSGHVRTKVGKAFGGETRLQLHTPTAVIGVKGTEWLTWYLNQLATTYVCTVEGIVTVESNDPTITDSYDPPVGSCAKILKHARPEPAELNALPAVGSGPVDVLFDTDTLDDTPIDPSDVPDRPEPPEPPNITPEPEPEPPPPPDREPPVDVIDPF